MVMDKKEKKRQRKEVEEEKEEEEENVSHAPCDATKSLHNGEW